MSKLRGAGAILHSPLVHTGFRLPEVEIIESDESYLLEIEVKVKLGKHDIFFQLQDILADFPAEALLQRPGLIQGLIDSIGTFLVTIEDHDSMSLRVQSMESLTYLVDLFHRCLEAFRQYLAGDLCASYPAFMKDKRSRIDDADNAAMEGVTASFSNEHEHERASDVNIGHDTVKTMYAMRYPLEFSPNPPVLNSGKHSAIEYTERIFKRFQQISERLKVPLKHILPRVEVAPQPSVSGLAFAVCAATLPLLRRQDLLSVGYISHAVRSLVPFALEPTAFRQITFAELSRSKAADEHPRSKALPVNKGKLSPAADAEGKRVNTVNKDRLQHLLNRVEQLLVAMGGQQYIHKATLGREIPDSSRHREELDTTNESNIAQPEDAFFHASFIEIILSILSVCPVSWLAAAPILAGTSATSTSAPDPAVDSSDSRLTVGKFTQQLLIHLLIDGTHTDSAYATHANLIKSVLDTLDSKLLSDLNAVNAVMKSVLSLKSMAEQTAGMKPTASVAGSSRPTAVPLDSLIKHLDRVLPLFNQKAYEEEDIAVSTQSYVLTQLQSTGIAKHVPGFLLTVCTHDGFVPHSGPSVASDTATSPQRKRLVEQALYILSHSPAQFQVDFCTSLLALIVHTADPSKCVSSLLIRAFVEHSCEGRADHAVVESLTKACVVGVEQRRVLESLGVNADAQDMSGLLDLVSDPLFIYTLLHQCIFKYEGAAATPVDTDDVISSENQFKLRCVVTCILEIVGNYALSFERIDETNVTQYTTLLYSLKYFVWGFNDHTLVAQPFPRNVFRLIAHIENICSNTKHDEISSVINKINVLGLFHTSAHVRSQCATSLSAQLHLNQREALSRTMNTEVLSEAFSTLSWKSHFWTSGANENKGPSDIKSVGNMLSSIYSADTTASVVPTSIISSYIDRRKEAIQQKKTTRKIENFEILKENVESAMFTRSYTHKDLHQLVDLAFRSVPQTSLKDLVTTYTQRYMGSIAGANRDQTSSRPSPPAQDFRTRTAALCQARILLSDHHIVHSSDYIWCQQLLLQCLQVIDDTSKGDDHRSSTDPNRDNNDAQTLSINATYGALQRDDHLAFVLEAVAMVKLLLSSLPSLRQCVRFDLQSSTLAHYPETTSKARTTTQVPAKANTQNLKELEKLNIKPIFDLLLFTRKYTMLSSTTKELSSSRSAFNTILRTATGTTQALSELSHLCCQVLYLLAAEASNWNFSQVTASTSANSNNAPSFKYKVSSDSVDSKHNQLLFITQLDSPKFLLNSPYLFRPNSESDLLLKEKLMLTTYSEDINKVDWRENIITATFPSLRQTVSISINQRNLESLIFSFYLSDSSDTTGISHLQNLTTKLLTSLPSTATTSARFGSSLQLLHSVILSEAHNTEWLAFLTKSHFTQYLIGVLSQPPRNPVEYLNLSQTLSTLMVYIDAMGRHQDTLVSSIFNIRSSPVFLQVLSDIFNSLLDPQFTILAFASLRENFLGSFNDSRVADAYLSELSSENRRASVKEPVSIQFKLKVQFQMLSLLQLLLKHGFWKRKDHILLTKERPLIHFLSLIVYNEFYPSSMRHLAGDIIQLILSSKSPEDAILLMTSTYEMETEPSQPHSTLPDPYRSNPFLMRHKFKWRPIDYILTFAKFAKQSDSCKVSSALKPSLKIVYLCLHLEYLQSRKSTTQRALLSGLSVSPSTMFDKTIFGNELTERSTGDAVNSGSKSRLDEWKWLLRLCYDRRTTIKVLSLECLRSLLQLYPDIHSESESGNAQNKTASLSHEMKPVQVWRLFDHFDHLVSDPSESVVTRQVCAKILLDRYSYLRSVYQLFSSPPSSEGAEEGKSAANQRYGASNENDENRLDSRQIDIDERKKAARQEITAECDQLVVKLLSGYVTTMDSFTTLVQANLSSDVPSPVDLNLSEIGGHIQTLVILLQLGNSDDVIARMRSLKVIPQLLKFLHTDSILDLCASTIGRALGLVRRNDPTNTQVVSNQWNSLWNSRQSQSSDDLLYLQGLFLNLLQTVRAVDPDTFQQTLQHTFFVQDLLYLHITPESTQQSKQVVSALDVRRVQSHIWYNNMMTVLIRSSISGSDTSTARKLTHQIQNQPSMVEKYLVENKGNVPLLLSISSVNLSQLLVHNLTLQMKEFLQQLDRFIEHDQVSIHDLVSPEYGALSFQLSSSLRLLGIMLGYAPIVRDMGFDRLSYTGEDESSGGTAGSKSSVEVKLLFTLLLQLHDAISTVLSHTQATVQSSSKSTNSDAADKQLRSVYSLLLSRVESSLVNCLKLSDECRQILFPLPTNTVNNANSANESEGYGNVMISQVVADIASVLSYIDSKSPKSPHSVSPAPITPSASSNMSSQKWRTHKDASHSSVSGRIANRSPNLTLHQQQLLHHQQHMNVANQQSHSTSAGYSKAFLQSHELPANLRKLVWSRLWLLQNLMAMIPKAQQYAASVGVHELLGRLLRHGHVWAVPAFTSATLGASSTAKGTSTATTTGSSHLLSDSHVPSYVDLSVAVVSAVFSFINECPKNRALFLSVGDKYVSPTAVLPTLSQSTISLSGSAIAAATATGGFPSVVSPTAGGHAGNVGGSQSKNVTQSNTTGGSGNIVYVLMNMSTTKGIPPAFRNILLQVIGKVMLASQITVGQKHLWETTLYSSLQRALHNSTVRETDSVLNLFYTWSATLVSQNNNFHPSKSSPVESTTVANSIAGSEMPIPELLTWILDKFQGSSVVDTAVIRFYGAIVHSYLQQRQTGAVESETKKLLLIVSSSQGLKILLRVIIQQYSRFLGNENISSITTPQQVLSTAKDVSSHFSSQGELSGLYTSLVLLNKILSLSEQAIATVKQLDSMSQLARVITVVSDISVNLSADSGSHSGLQMRPSSVTNCAHWEEVTNWLRHLLL